MKKGIKSRHHIYPKQRHSDLKHKYTRAELETTIRIYHEKHKQWHILFGNLTIREIIELLTRVERLAKRKRGLR